MKSNAHERYLDKELENAVQEAAYEALTPGMRREVFRLLQMGQTPKQIEDFSLGILDRKAAHLPAWKRQELAGRYYLAAQYALKNNLHLN